MKNLKIGKKLIVTFGIVLLLFLSCIIIAVSCLRSVGGNFDSFYNQTHQTVVAQLDMRRAFQSAVKNILHALLTENGQQSQALVNDAEQDMAAIKVGLATLQEKFEGDQTMVANFKAKMDASIPYKEQIYELAINNRQLDGLKIYNESYAPLLKEAQEYLTQIGEDCDNRALIAFQSGNMTQTIATWVLIGAAIGSLLLIIIFCTYITRSITVPLQEIETAAKNMSKGSLESNITYSSKDEMGSLAESMRITTAGIANIVKDVGYLLGEMANGNFRIRTRAEENYIGDFAPILAAIRKINRSLSSTLSQINQSSDQVASGSDQVASGSQALSQGATEQASSVEELAATITEISSQVRLNAENAQTASRKANLVGEEMMASNEQMKQMMAAMADISNSSNEIGKIIKTIEDIAFQTNILALNAAVEAARAGAAGKGFAVVADEVRNLASKSAEASKNTAALIEGSIHAVGNGTKIADETAQSLLKAVDGAKEVTELIDRISDASNAQADSINQVTQGVDQISAVVQTNSATAEESAAASEELSGQAQVLKNLVSRFTLRDDAADSGISQSAPAIPAAPAPVSGDEFAASYSGGGKY